MPTIPKLKDKKKPPSQRKSYRQSLYSDRLYRQYRDWFMKSHQYLCEECLKDGLITTAEHCHHTNDPFNPNISRDEALRRLRDMSQCKCLCVYHHEMEHSGASKEMKDNYQKRLNYAKNNNTATEPNTN